MDGGCDVDVVLDHVHPFQRGPAGQGRPVVADLDLDDFRCTIERGDGMITVHEEPISSGPIPDPQMWLERSRSSPVAEEFEADAPGHGFASTRDPGVADWSCGERYLMVTISGTVRARDKRADVIAYLTSMLPWGCGDAEPPEADAQP